MTGPLRPLPPPPPRPLREELILLRLPIVISSKLNCHFWGIHFHFPNNER